MRAEVAGNFPQPQLIFFYILEHNGWHYVVDKLSRELFNLRDDVAEIKFIHFSELLSSFYHHHHHRHHVPEGLGMFPVP